MPHMVDVVQIEKLVVLPSSCLPGFHALEEAMMGVTSGENAMCDYELLSNSDIRL